MRVAGEFGEIYFVFIKIPLTYVYFRKILIPYCHPTRLVIKLSAVRERQSKFALSPRDGDFELFCSSTENLALTAKEFYGLLDKINALSAKNFDPDDVHELVYCINDLVDFFTLASKRVSEKRIKPRTAEVRTLTKLSIKSIHLIQIASELLTQGNKPSHLLKICKKLAKLNHRIDHLTLASATKQSRYKKEFLGFLNAISDRCSDIIHLLETILLESLDLPTLEPA